MLADILHKLAGQYQEPRSSHWRRPSMAGPERCIRSLVYQASGVPADPLPERTWTVFDDGQWHEELTLDWLRKSAFKVHSQQMSVETLVGTGHIDAIVTDLAGVDRLLEHKSINHFGFDRLRKEPPLDYLTQSCLYVAGLEEEYGHIQEGILLFKNKNTGAYAEIVFRYERLGDSLTVLSANRTDGEEFEWTTGFEIKWITFAAVEKFAEVELHAKAGTVPPRPFELGTTFPCGYCGWERTCWEGYQSEIEALSDDVALSEEVETMCRYYLEQSGHEKAAKEEKEKLRAAIKTSLLAAGGKAAKVGPYTVSLRLEHRAEAVMKASTFDVLTIRKLKEVGR